MIDSSGCDLAVSVHLNSFTQDETVRGAQVFYGGGGKKAVAGKSRRLRSICSAPLTPV